MFLMYTSCASELIYIYMKCMQNVMFLHTIVSHISTKLCIDFVYKMFLYKMYTTFGQTLICKMYTKRLYTQCIPHFNKLLYTFQVQNLASIVLLILYTKCIYTKVCRNVVYILYNQLYRSCTIFLYTQFLCGIEILLQVHF